MPNNYSSAALLNHPQFFNAWLQGVYWGHQSHVPKASAKIFLYEKGYWCTFMDSRRNINMLLLTTCLVAAIAGATGPNSKK